METESENSAHMETISETSVTSSKMGPDADEISDYSLATYIRQNSENFQRLNSLTDSVCHTEEERKLIEKELFQESREACTCNRDEYCSSHCKDADKQLQLLPTQTVSPSPPREVRISMPETKSEQSHDKCTCSRSPRKVGKKTVKETRFEMTPISSRDSIDSEKLPAEGWSGCKLALVILAAVVGAVLLTVLVCMFVVPWVQRVGHSKEPVNKPIEVTGHARHTVRPEGTAARTDNRHHDFEYLRREEEYVSFKLDQDRFEKGDQNLRWIANENSQDITLDENDCIRVSKTAHYQIYSKVTFEFWKNNRTSQVYHVVQLDRGSEREMLDKNVVTVPPPALRPAGRMLKSSLVWVLQKFHADDVICVMVSDTRMVYTSPIDSSLKIIRKL